MASNRSVMAGYLGAVGSRIASDPDALAVAGRRPLVAVPVAIFVRSGPILRLNSDAGTLHFPAIRFVATHCASFGKPCNLVSQFPCLWLFTSARRMELGMLVPPVRPSLAPGNPSCAA